MTTIRIRTARKIENLLRKEGPMTAWEISRALDKHQTTIQKYLRYSPGLFKKTGKKKYTAHLWDVTG